MTEFKVGDTALYFLGHRWIQTPPTRGIMKMPVYRPALILEVMPTAEERLYTVTISTLSDDHRELVFEHGHTLHYTNGGLYIQKELVRAGPLVGQLSPR